MEFCETVDQEWWFMSCSTTIERSERQTEMEQRLIVTPHHSSLLDKSFISSGLLSNSFSGSQVFP